MRHLIDAAGLAAQVEVDSAGTGGWHAGELPDPRTRATARRRGVELGHRARQIEPRDLERFDHVIALDREHLRDLRALARGDRKARLALLRSFDDAAPPDAEVPDPYYGGDDGFEHVYDLCERACRGLLAQVRRELDAR
jgi:low molecular weight protein-tyrosine phosphatase